ncbi:DUF3667 domain-containing protein [Polaribacter marinaquae]|uniref:DUF3667 domain-containing protein n=1 Tax=Polaribacter marinaquae TaxID=1642819 RepID=A0ABZ2TMH5_9FLAO
MFNGVFNFDAKFWKTLIPLLTNPGKVSKDYKEGKRSRYSNPFRFYITVSIISFLILGLKINYKKYQALVKADVQKELSINEKINNTEIERDSITKIVQKELDKSIIPISKKQKKEILDDIEKEENDSIKKKKAKKRNFSFGKGTRIEKFLEFQKEHPKTDVDDALDSLKYSKNFNNRFLYQRVKVMNKVMDDNDSYDKFVNESLSYISISLFIFLPLFTLFLKLLYVRRKFTYVDHLIFVFHTQTVFFMLLTIVYILSFFMKVENASIFILIFLTYLFLAMKKFYNQGYIKTLFKFLMLNFVYMIMAVLGVVLVTLISFAIY